MNYDGCESLNVDVKELICIRNNKKTIEMTNAKNEFSLFDFCKKRADKVQIYGLEYGE